MKYILLDKEDIVISIGDNLEENEKSFKIDNIVFYKEDGFHYIKMDKVDSKVKVLDYKYMNGKLKKIDSWFSKIKKRKGM